VDILVAELMMDLGLNAVRGGFFEEDPPFREEDVARVAAWAAQTLEINQGEVAARFRWHLDIEADGNDRSEGSSPERAAGEEVSHWD
jgi:hypothetical protein